jgi:hypothetical protein
MRPIVNKIHDEELEERMSDEESLCRQDACITKELNSEQQGAKDAVEVLRLRLGLTADSDRETVILTADRRLAELMDEASRREAEQRVASATRAGKLIPVQHDWAMALALSDPAGFDEWAATAPVVVSLGRTQPPQEADSTGRGKAAIIASARAAFRAEPSLALLTSEEAWVAQAMREAAEE